MGQAAISGIVPPDGRVSGGYERLSKTQPDGKQNLSFLVSGAYCAACIQKIESSLKSYTGVTTTRLNFSTGKLFVEWEGPISRANDFVQAVENLGYAVRPYDEGQKKILDEEERFLMLCLGIAGFAMGNIMLVSVGLWTTTTQTMGEMTRDFMHWVSAIIAIPAVLFCGRPFFRSALNALSKGRTNMDVPISIGLILTLSISLFETMRRGEDAFFDSAVMLVFFLLIGRYLDFRARKQAKDSAADLLAGMDGFAKMIEDDGSIINIPIRQLCTGQIVQIAVGEKFPADGIIHHGNTDVDISLVTGESVPSPVVAGEKIYAGTINLTAPVTMRVSKAAEDSLLADLSRLMEQAVQGQAKYVRMADRAARLYTPVVHTLAALAFIGWFFIGHLPWEQSLMIAVTVLIITCPCALGLAVPVVQVLATGKLMKAGILVKSGDALERLAAIDTIFLDKTGTLTLGKPALTFFENEEVLKRAASLAGHSHHPLSRALCESYKGQLVGVQNVIEHPGQGLEATLEGQMIRLGSRTWCGNTKAEDIDQIELWYREGNNNPSLFCFSDQLRSDSANTIGQFHRVGLYPVLISGDRAPIVEKIAHECLIDSFYAHMKPQEKFVMMEDAQNSGRNVLMIGDGLNDAPTLAKANVSMAPGTAIDVAQNAADIIFMGDRLAPVYQTYETARMTQKLVKENFLLAVIYNLVAIPLAVAGMVNPLVAAIAMSGSSLVVIANSFRLRFAK